MPDRNIPVLSVRRSRPDPLRIVSIGGEPASPRRSRVSRNSPSIRLSASPQAGPRSNLGDRHRLGRRRELGPLAARVGHAPAGRYPQLHGRPGRGRSLLTRLFQYRFAAGKGLKGHSFGNLFLAVMSQVTGDFARAVQLSSEALAIAGRIFPATGEKVRLRGHLAGGRMVEGETRISRSSAPIEHIEPPPASCKPLPEALEAIRNADLITLGPGSLYTSIVPNLLVKGVARAIEQSPALKACFINPMWQPGETTGLTAADHIAAIECHAARRLVEVAVLNTAPIPERRLRRYERKAARPVETDLARPMALACR